MAGNTSFDLSAARPEKLPFKGTFPNGQRRNLVKGTLDRSASFREGNEGQTHVSGAITLRGNSTSSGDSASAAHSLVLGPITTGDQKYQKCTGSGELRRILGISFGNTLEDYAFGTANLKSPLPVAKEELQRFTASLQEASVRARCRSKKLDESLHRLNKCWETVNSKKQLRNELLPNERLGGSHGTKLGSQTHWSPSELVNQRVEDRPMNVILNKRTHTSASELLNGGRSNNFVMQPLRDNINDSGKGCDISEEKVRRLPAGGETWDRKMKRKRSMGTVFARLIDAEGELKRVMHLKLANESVLHPSGAQGLRLNSCDNNYTGGISTLTKDKPSRAPRTGHLIAGNSSSVSHSSETPDAWEQPSNVNKTHSISGTTNPKRPLPVGSSSSHMAQWVGQRPQKISRTRRATVVSPVLNCDEMLMSLESCSPSDVGTSMTSNTTSGSLIPKGAINTIQVGRVKHENVSSLSRLSKREESGAGENGESILKEKGLESNEVDEKAINNSHNMRSSSLVMKNKKMPNNEEIGDGLRKHGRGRGSSVGRVKHENVSSPSRLSEREESGAGENGESILKEKGLESNEVDEKAINNSHNMRSSLLVMKNKKMPNNEEIGDGLRKHGRGRGSSVLKTGISPMKDKSEISTLTTPIRNMNSASEKNGSKSGGLPLKKSRGRKAIALTSRSLNIAGESDNDREELLDAANFASNARYIGCSSSFWKKLEPNFAPVNLEDIAYLKQLVQKAEVDQRCLSQMLCLGHDATSQDGVLHMDNLPLQSPLVIETGRSILHQAGSKEISSMVDMVDQPKDCRFLCRQMGLDGNKVAPLYQRVLTALIIDDQTDEETVRDGNMSFMCERDDSPPAACFSQDVVNQSSNRSEYAFNSDKVSCNGNATFTSDTNIHDQELDGFLQVDQGPLYPETGGLMGMHKTLCSSSLNCHYEQMSMEDKLLLELQSVGLYPEPVPDLDDGDCESIDQEIIQLQKGLFQQVTKKREYFMKLIQAVEESREMEQRALEQVAMDKLVELAYKKKLATRGTTAARFGFSKVSRSVALAFMKRTLARCRKFEETGKSCFLEPPFKDVLFATPARDNVAGAVVAVNPSLTHNSQQESAGSGLFPSREQDVLGNLEHPSDQDFARTGRILNRGKKKEVLLDDVGASASLRSESTLGNSFMGGAKRKKSERQRGKDTSGRNSVTKGEYRTKAKAKPKTAKLSTSGNGSLSKLMEDTNSEHQLASGSSVFISSGGNSKSKDRSLSHDTKDLPIETKEPMDLTNLHELDPIELGVANELNGDQDLESWFNIDEEGLLDTDAVGLDIPMDDLSELSMVL